MRRKTQLARLFRALSGESQKDFGERTGIEANLVAQYELGKADPGPENLERLARGTGLTVAAGDQILRLAESLRRPRSRVRYGLGGEENVRELLAPLITCIYQRMLRVPLAGPAPRPGDRNRAAELWALLKDLPEDQQSAVVRVGQEFQSWALAERVCEESVPLASSDIDHAMSLARLGRELAERVRGPEGWRNRVRGFATAHFANIQRVAGQLKTAETAFQEAKLLWDAGSDPDQILDPGRLLDLEASLRRDQRRFEEALTLLDKARGVSRCPAHTLISKGFTLEVMGEYKRAIQALLEARPLVERQDDPRLCYNRLFNLAVNYCHLGRFEEAAELVQQVRDLVDKLGDEIFLKRVVWLEGRIAAGLGQPAKALRLLEQARRGFAEKGMGYDAALALLEEAVLLLEEGGTAEVKALAPELARVFAAKGVHREALGALQLFQEAAEREEATADLARRILRYLFRARHDEGLRFEE